MPLGTTKRCPHRRDGRTNKRPARVSRCLLQTSVSSGYWWGVGQGLISEVRLAQPRFAQNRFEDLYHPVGSQIIGSLSGKPHERVLREILRRLARILRIRRSNHAAIMLQPEQ